MVQIIFARVDGLALKLRAKSSVGHRIMFASVVHQELVMTCWPGLDDINKTIGSGLSAVRSLFGSCEPRPIT